MAEYVVTDCVLHGTKVASDLASARIYTRIVREEWRDIALKADRYGHERGDHEHQIDVHSDGSDCWVCCSLMDTRDWS